MNDLVNKRVQVARLQGFHGKYEDWNPKVHELTAVIKDHPGWLVESKLCKGWHELKVNGESVPVHSDAEGKWYAIDFEYRMFCNRLGIVLPVKL